MDLAKIRLWRASVWRRGVRSFSYPAVIRPGSELLVRLANHGDKLALIDKTGRYTYRHLFEAATKLAGRIDKHLIMERTACQPRIAYLQPRNHTYVISQWATWQCGAIGVPLPEGYPATELDYFLKDSAPSVILTSHEYRTLVGGTASTLHIPVEEVHQMSSLSIVGESRASAASRAGINDVTTAPETTAAMIVYTSGTTQRPKGVLTPHSALLAQICALVQAWEWSTDDRILHVLPLHHVHGIMAKMLCAFYVGAAVELMPSFDAAATWAALLRPKDHPDACSVFMAVPTIYSRLIEHYMKQPDSVRVQWTDAIKNRSKIRLMVSGSAALPSPVMKAWFDITGHTLLERFGMTEFGMAISNPYRGERISSSIGKPLPRYEVRLTDDAGHEVTSALEPGELQVRGPGVFSGYWRKPEATRDAFTSEGWFKTGDFAHADSAGNFYIQGRISADIIKSGGYKISALEIERVLLEHPDIAEVAVVGAADAMYGERVAAVIVRKDKQIAPAAAESLHLREWAREKLVGYKIPSIVHLLSAIPRNAMGKVNKKELKQSLGW